MPLPVPDLDDRRFDDLVAEARARLSAHLPELTQLSPGDPAHALIDLFAWLTETILFRANLIPERQRRILLNLLQIPVRPAKPARGVVCVDAGPGSVQSAPLLRDGTQLKAGQLRLTALGELQPTALSLHIAIKQRIDASELAAMGLTLQDLQEQFGLRRGEKPEPFQPRHFEPDKEILTLSRSLDRCFYLAAIAPKPLAAELALLRAELAGQTINLALCPADELEGEAVNELNPRVLVWELLSSGEDGETIYLPLEILSDSSRGARQQGVVRLRLPNNAQLFKAFAPSDPMFSGLGEQPPELTDRVQAERVAFWLRLRCPEHPELKLRYLAINAVEVLAQGLKEDLIVGVGTGQPDQRIALPDEGIAPDSLQLDVEELGHWVRWQRVDFLAGQRADAKVFRLNPETGHVYFGDGVSAGKRPPLGQRIRAAAYLFGGGAVGNLPPGSVKEVVGGSPRYKLRQPWPLTGGRDAETVEAAEKRIPQFLTHRNRAVTAQDFKLLTEANPVNPVARAEVMPGFMPGATIRAARSNVPGVISVFVLPPAAPAVGATPKPTEGLLKDVFAYLLQRIMVGTELYVLSPEFVPLAVSVTLQVREQETEQQTLRAVHYAIVDYLWPLAPGGAHGHGWAMGQPVHGNELLTQVARVEGVLAVNALALFRRTPKGWRRLKADEALTLTAYQLPELLGVRADSGNGTPALPGGIGALEGQKPDNARGVPVPVIPDLC